MSDNRPSPKPVKMQLDWVRFRPGLLQSVNGPHGQIGHQKKGDYFSPGLPPDLLRGHAGPPGSVQDENCLASRLDQRR